MKAHPPAAGTVDNWAWSADSSKLAFLGNVVAASSDEVFYSALTGGTLTTPVKVHPSGRFTADAYWFAWPP